MPAESTCAMHELLKKIIIFFTQSIAYLKIMSVLLLDLHFTYLHIHIRQVLLKFDTYNLFLKVFLLLISHSFTRITYQTISKLTFFMKVLHFSLLNNILQHEINEKPCWKELFFI